MIAAQASTISRLLAAFAFPLTRQLQAWFVLMLRYYYSLTPKILYTIASAKRNDRSLDTA